MQQFSTSERRKLANARYREEFEALQRQVNDLRILVETWQQMGATVLFQSIIKGVFLKMKSDGEL